MAWEYRTLKFKNDSWGLWDKDRTVQRLMANGWRVTNESVVSGHMKGKEACCLATLCLPMGFLAGRTPGEIIVTLTRETQPPAITAQQAGVPIGRAAESRVRDTARRNGPGIGATIGYALGRSVRKVKENPLWFFTALGILVFVWFIHQYLSTP